MNSRVIRSWMHFLLITSFFLELSDEERYKINDQQFRILQNTVDVAVDQQLNKINYVYYRARNADYLGCPKCSFVRNGTFSTFLHEKLLIDRVSPIQLKPHRLLKNEQHIQFFYDNQIDNASS